MVGVLLWRGMLVGVFAGIICFALLKLAGEPPVDRAIAFEAQLEAANRLRLTPMQVLPTRMPRKGRIPNWSAARSRPALACLPA
jgi:hypothetical protein